MPSTMAEDKSISFNNILVRTEVSVESHMKVKAILGVIGGIVLQQFPLAAATNATQTLSKMIRRQVLPASLHKKFLRQHQEKTPRHKRDPDPVDHQEPRESSGVATSSGPPSPMGVWRNQKKNH